MGPPFLWFGDKNLDFLAVPSPLRGNRAHGEKNSRYAAIFLFCR